MVNAFSTYDSLPIGWNGGIIQRQLHDLHHVSNIHRLFEMANQDSKYKAQDVVILHYHL